MKELKFLYETKVKKQVEEKVKELKEEQGQKVEITRTVKKAQLVKLAILKPHRKLFEQAEIFYAKSIADFIRQGLLPYSLVAKRYNNDGGPLSEPEKNRIEELKKEADVLESKFFEIAALTDEESAKEKGEIIKKVSKLNQMISEINNSYADIFDNTAEVKARNRIIEWWTLNLSYMEENGVLKPLFGEGDYADKLLKYDDIEEKEDPFFSDSIKRLSYLISFWFSARTIIDKLDFAGMEKVYDSTVSNYIVEEDKVELTVEDKTPPTPPTS